MRCWTRTAKDGHRYTTCDGNQGAKKRDGILTRPTKGQVEAQRIKTKVASMTQTATNIASLLRMNSDADTSKMMRTRQRPPSQFQQFSGSDEYKRRVDVPPRTMGTRGTPIAEKAPSADPFDEDFFDDVTFEDLGEIELTDEE